MLIQKFKMTKSYWGVDTNSDIVTNSNPQLEKPISMPAATPVGANFLNDFLQSMCTRDFPVKQRYVVRTAPAMTSFNTKW